MTDRTLDADHVKEVVRRHWSARAADFDTGPTHGLLNDEQRAAWHVRLVAWSQGSEQHLDVLDVGCGTGFLALQLAELGHRAVGVDVAQDMLELARGKAAGAGLEARFELADAEQLPFADAMFDLVIERHVIWTLPQPDAALREWARVLRRGGRVVLIEGDWQRGSVNPDYTQIVEALPLYGGRPATQIEERVAAAGFSQVTVEPLMDTALWGSQPQSERYAVIGRR